MQHAASDAEPLRLHFSYQVWKCWKCHRRATVRISFRIIWLDGRPRRIYRPQASPRCQACGEELEYLARRDEEEGPRDRCKVVCQPARHDKQHRCTCKVCHGALHGAAR